MESQEEKVTSKRSTRKITSDLEKNEVFEISEEILMKIPHYGQRIYVIVEEDAEKELSRKVIDDPEMTTFLRIVSQRVKGVTESENGRSVLINGEIRLPLVPTELKVTERIWTNEAEVVKVWEDLMDKLHVAAEEKANAYRQYANMLKKNRDEKIY